MGKEAARLQMMVEIQEAFSGVYINYHHLSVLCDNIFSSESPKPVFRSGIIADTTGPLSKSTFEIQTEIMLDASRHALLDSVTSVSASVMLGQRGKFGTNYSQVLLDTSKLTINNENTVSEAHDFIRPVDQEPDDINELIAKDTCKPLVIANNIQYTKNIVTETCNDDYTIW